MDKADVTISKMKLKSVALQGTLVKSGGRLFADKVGVEILVEKMAVAARPTAYVRL